MSRSMSCRMSIGDQPRRRCRLADRRAPCGVRQPDGEGHRGRESRGQAFDDASVRFAGRRDRTDRGDAGVPPMNLSTTSAPGAGASAVAEPVAVGGYTAWEPEGVGASAVGFSGVNASCRPTRLRRATTRLRAATISCWRFPERGRNL